MKALQGKLTAVNKTLTAIAVKARRVFMLSGAAIAGTVYAAAKFEDQLAMVSTMLDKGTMKYMKEYKRGLETLSVEFGEATGTLTKGLYDILSASIAPTKAMDVLTVAVKSAKAGFTSTAVSADAITTILNSYGMEAERAAEISDKLFATVKRGKLTYAELAGSIGKAAATAATAGLSLDELLASIATITRAGITSDQAMTAVIGTIRSFLKPTTEGAKLARELGFELNTATLRAEGLSGVFKKLTKLSAEQLAQIFPNIRGLKGVAAAMQDLRGHAFDLNLMMKATGLTQEALTKATATFTHKMNQLKQSVIAMARAVGIEFIPFLEKAITAIRRWAEAFGNLSKETKTTIAKITLLTLGISGLLTALPLVTTSLKVFVGLLTAITAHPIIAIVTAIGLLIIGIVQLIRKNEKLSAAFSNAFKFIAESINKVVSVIKEVLQPVLLALEMMFKEIGTVMAEAWRVGTNALKEMAAVIWEAVKPAFDWWLEWSEIVLRVMIGVFKKIISWLRDKIVGAIINVTVAIKMWREHLELLWLNWKFIFVRMFETIKHLFGTQIPKLLDWFYKNWHDVFTTMWNLTKTVFSNMWKNISMFFENVWKWLKGEETDWVWTGLLEGFKSTLKEMPKITKRLMTDTEKELVKRIAELTKKIADARAEMWARIFWKPGGVGIKGVAPPPIVEKEPIRSIEGKREKKKEKQEEKGEKEKEEKRDAGRWMGMADVWKNIQSGIMKNPIEKQQLKEQKEANIKLGNIEKGVEKMAKGSLGVGVGLAP